MDGGDAWLREWLQSEKSGFLSCGTVRKNAIEVSIMSTTARMQRCDWREDLQASRDLDPRTKDGFGFFLGWYESWPVFAALRRGKLEVAF